jgi:AraC family transcriptional regulator
LGGTLSGSVMDVVIATFPQTRVAAITHVGLPSLEYDTARKLIAWKIENRLLDPSRNRSYGLHYADPNGPTPSKYRVDFCLSLDGPIPDNPYGIVEMSIPSLKCALARDVGSRANNQAAKFLYETWLPASGQQLSGHPLIFHYVNVGPNVKAHEAVTDVYMPIQ